VTLKVKGTSLCDIWRDYKAADWVTMRVLVLAESQWTSAVQKGLRKAQGEQKL
jgi:hypothetical protein